MFDLKIKEKGIFFSTAAAVKKIKKKPKSRKNISTFDIIESSKLKV
jgi:hypothetical protein